MKTHSQFVWTAFLLMIYLAGSAAAAQQPRAVSDAAMAKAVEAYFTAKAGYQPGDLVTRSEVEKIATKLDRVGYKLNNPSAVAKTGLPDDSFLAREFATPDGRRFIRKVGQHTGGYSHLDRLTTTQRGETIVRDLMRQKDGDKFIEYLTTTKGGRNMGSMMAQARGGTDLNKPTGRIYTVEDLLTALKAAHSKAAQ